MRRFLIIVTALAALASGPTARADFFDTSMGVLVGGSMNLGTLGDKFQLTSWPPMVGMEANIRHSWLGLLWSFQVSDYNEGGKNIADNVNITLDMWEMDFGLRAHVHPDSRYSRRAFRTGDDEHRALQHPRRRRRRSQLHRPVAGRRHRARLARVFARDRVDLRPSLGRADRGEALSVRGSERGGKRLSPRRASACTTRSCTAGRGSPSRGRPRPSSRPAGGPRRGTCAPWPRRGGRVS